MLDKALQIKGAYDPNVQNDDRLSAKVLDFKASVRPELFLPVPLNLKGRNGPYNRPRLSRYSIGHPVCQVSVIPCQENDEYN
ncbi:MAG: hypothetical protein ABSE51_05110 [Terracidiphilus sp.]|jgi:hypothetical protein